MDIGNENIRPDFSEEDAQRILNQDYSMKAASLTELESYLDRNFLAVTPTGEKFVLKIYNQTATTNLRELELKHSMEKECSENGISCPVPVRTKSGKNYTTTLRHGTVNYVDLHTYISGLPYKSIKHIHGPVHREIGRLAASIDVICKKLKSDFTDLCPGYNIWHLENIPRFLRHAHQIEQEDIREMLEEILNAFQTKVLDQMEKFSKGPIHNDMSEGNLLLEEDEHTGEYHLAGVIDFGDVSNNSPYVFEVAISMTYVLHVTNDISCAHLLLESYLSILPLTYYEISCIPCIILARLAQSYLMSDRSLNENEYAVGMGDSVLRTMKTYYQNMKHKKNIFSIVEGASQNFESFEFYI